MKNKISLVLTLFVIVGLCSCVSTGSGSEDDWPGIYAGVIPSAGGSGISVVAILYPNRTYKITYYYIDKEDTLYPSTGNLTWDGKENLITLDSGSLPRYYKVGKNTLTQLDIEGNRITGNLAENYILQKY